MSFKTYKIAFTAKGTTHNEQRKVPSTLWKIQKTYLNILFITFGT